MLQYRRALRHADPDPGAQRAELLRLLGYERYLTDRIEDALLAETEALRIWAALEDGRAGRRRPRWLSRLNWFIGRNGAGRVACRAGTAVLAGTGSVELAMAQQQRAPSCGCWPRTWSAPGSGPARRWHCWTGCRTGPRWSRCGCTR